MKFFKNLKEAILGSIKEDLNSAFGGKQTLFNSKISGALDDLIAMKTGINISKNSAVEIYNSTFNCDDPNSDCITVRESSNMLINQST